MSGNVGPHIWNVSNFTEQCPVHIAVVTEILVASASAYPPHLAVASICTMFWTTEVANTLSGSSSMLDPMAALLCGAVGSIWMGGSTCQLGGTAGILDPLATLRCRTILDPVAMLCSDALGSMWMTGSIRARLAAVSICIEWGSAWIVLVSGKARAGLGLHSLPASVDGLEGLDGLQSFSAN